MSPSGEIMRLFIRAYECNTQCGSQSSAAITLHIHQERGNGSFQCGKVVWGMKNAGTMGQGWDTMLQLQQICH